MVVADSWFSDSKLMQHVRNAYQGTLLVEGKVTYCFTLADGRQIKGHDLIEGKGWCWHQHPWEVGIRYVRLRATSPTYGQVTVVIVDEPGQDRFYLVCLETERSAPQLIRRWRRRSWIEYCFRTLKHLLATGACQVQSEDAYYGHLVLRLMGCFILLYTSQVVCKGRLTMEEIIFSLKHYWRFVDSEALELKALSSGKAGKPHEYWPNSEIGRVRGVQFGEERALGNGHKTPVSHAGVQISRPCATVSLRVWSYCPTLPTETSFAVRIRISSRDEASIRELGRDHGHGAGCLRGREDRGRVPGLPGDDISLNKLTEPRETHAWRCQPRVR